jgi:hypothetical protein
VFVDEDTGEIWFQGETVTDPAELAEREPATQRTRTGPGWVTDPRTLRRVRDALASLPRRQP